MPVPISRHAVAAQPAPHDLRFRIVDARADQPPRAIATFDDLAIVLGRQKRFDFVAEDPRMTQQHARPCIGSKFDKRKRRHAATFA
jgi:hypothetical protein